MENSITSTKENKISGLSLFKKNVYSQFGEDGIIEKIFETIKDGDKWCVEFGAADGVFCSNTYNLTKNFDWNAVLVEASRSSFEKLKEAHRNSKNSILINKFVEFEGENKLDSILSETPIPRNFDFLSIDIDGNDYYIWESLVQYRPKVVLIEFNPTIPDSVDFVQPKNMSVTQGSSVSAIARLGKKKDYELVAVTDSNAVFVDKKYFELFDIKDNSISTLREVHKYETVFFQLYDGTIVIQGLDKLFWHELNLNDTIQIIPKMFRKYPGNLHGLRKFFYKVFKFFRKRL